MKKTPDRKVEIKYIPDNNNELALKAIIKIVQLALESKKPIYYERKEDSYE